MSVPSTSLPFIRVTAISVCPESESGKGPKHLNSGKLHIGPRKHKLICAANGSLCQEFQNVELSPETRVTLHYKSSRWLGSRVRVLDTQSLFAPSAEAPTRDLLLAQDGIRIEFSCQATETVLSPPQHEEALSPTHQSGAQTPTSQTPEILVPTTQGILENCPRFRILVIGKSGVGKSSLINTAFGISKASSSHLQRGIADIEEELVSPVNKRFILHDSLGFEPGDEGNYGTVKKFIKSRQTGELKDRLHTVWFCVQIPRSGGRLLEVAAEDFFRTKKETMGTIPIIVVYTMLDSFVDELTIQLAKSSELDDAGLTKEARSKAVAVVEERHKEITKLAGQPLPYVAVSKNYEDTLKDLVNLTYREVGMRDVPDAQITSVVTLMAQRVDPHLKIEGTIEVGRQRYWKALRTSANFQGHIAWDCLSVIHADIVAVWNFNDPACHLLSDEFKQLVVNMGEKTDTPSTSNTSKIIAFGTSSAGAISGLSALVSSSAVPIILPVVVGVVAVVWLNDLYQNVKKVQQKFVTFIVDLTHILKTLFILTAHDHNKITRRAVKLALRLYHDSGVMNQAHIDVQGYNDGVWRGSTPDMIESMIKPERNGDANLRRYYEGLAKINVRELNLDQEEEWESGGVGR